MEALRTLRGTCPQVSVEAPDGSLPRGSLHGSGRTPKPCGRPAKARQWPCGSRMEALWNP
eukprot:3390875-Alexandrium_andersonii.AAC.1